jgi:cysteine-rich repeat protein
MSRAVHWKLTCAAALTAIAGCAAQDPGAGDEVDGLAMDLEVEGGVDLDLVSFTVQSESAQPMTGTLPMAGGLPIRHTIEGVADGRADVKVRGSSKDGSLCEGSGKTSLHRGRHTPLLILLHCWLHGHRDDGGMDNDNECPDGGQHNDCPDADLATCASSTGRVGGPPIALSASASARDDDQLEFHWSASEGTFSDEDAQSTEYTCTSEGTQTIAFTVENKSGCKDRLEFPIVCSAPAQPQCGNGEVETGEECDDGNLVPDDGCGADCRFDEANDSELCGADPGGALENCTCERCTQFVFAAENAEGVAAAGPAAGRPKSELAIELLECMRDTGCEGFTCLCGTVPPMMCRENVASNGPCKTQFLAAAETTMEGEAEDRMNDTDFAIGLAFAVEDCAAKECGDCL